ncbi:hypothetical protein OIU85_000924 [Salix viminalis]|uniref:MADS-box domain-containing protein n=1 Tax=Salix viminalis TaxID=40686 RepID=A0A9Q0VKJ7_SALVM|nr:hypothetical protein OIU85_000924 [Salix viminalis]
MKHLKTLNPFQAFSISNTTMDAANQQQQETRRTSKGRQKIEIKRVEKESNRYVTFSKRKNGLFKKATELSTLCGAETAVIIFSEHRKLFSCGQPDVDQVLDRYLAETERVPNNFPSLIKNNVENQLANKQEYAESLKRLEEEQTVAKMIGSMNNMNGGGFWWDLPIDNMEQDELEAYRESMEELKKNLIARLGLIESTCNALSESRIANPFINLKEIPSSLSFNSHQCQ